MAFHEGFSLNSLAFDLGGFVAHRRDDGFQRSADSRRVVTDG